MPVYTISSFLFNQPNITVRKVWGKVCLVTLFCLRNAEKAGASWKAALPCLQGTVQLSFWLLIKSVGAGMP